MALIGNTVRLKAEFRDYEGMLMDPDPESVRLTLYDGRRKRIGESIIPERVETGIYRHEHVVTGDDLRPVYFEFAGTAGGMPILGRAILESEWTER